MKSTLFIKCKCGHTFKEIKDVEPIIIITKDFIEEIKYTVDYICPKCENKGHATGYFH
jgi:DNA-directed RNA polymerase subunit M/transcription elongation factor TFIIS